MEQESQLEANKIVPGLPVETTEGDLGADDLTPPHVSGVIRDEAGNVERVVVRKGFLFRKEIEVPAERVQAIEVDPQSGATPTVVIAASEAEIESLSPVGPEPLRAGERATAQADAGLLETVSRSLPTDAGLRHLELEAQHKVAAASTAEAQAKPGSRSFLGLGPGFLAGISGKDASAVTTYAVDGAQVGYSHLWIVLLATPLLQAVQFACAKLGRVNQKGLADVLREHYGQSAAVLASLLLVMANLALIAANLVAIGSGLQLITGIGWTWFVLPVALTLWYITVYQDFESFKKVFLVMSLAFLAYILTGALSGADWGAVLTNTFVPTLDMRFVSISGAVGVLGATISPYTLFWQVHAEKEEARHGPTPVQLRSAGWDIASGVVSSNLIAYSIIVATAATLFANGEQINTAIDAARALEPLLGPFAKYLFAIGLIGAGLIAIPVLMASASFAVAGTIGWPAGLSRKPWQSEGFYLIMTIALLTSLVVAFLGLDPISLMFWANVLQGVLSSVLVLVIFMVGNNRNIMREHRLNKLTNASLLLTILLMFCASGLLIFWLLTGQST